jgi:hypothetical protein
MLPRALLIGGFAALTLPAAASAATLSTTSTQAVYQAAQGDLVELQVYGGWDDDLHASATYFLPVNGNQTDPTTADAACVARPAGASSCARTGARLHLAGQDDFVGVGAAGETVEVHLGGGKDRMWTTGSKVVAFGDAGDDSVQGGPGFDQLDGGTGDDTLDPYSFGDVVTGGPGFDTVRYSGHTETVIVTLDDVANDGRRATTGHIADGNNIRSDVEQVIGGSGDDELEGNAGANSLRGGDGADVLTGSGGADTFAGDAGADTINARDGVADAIDCGPGADIAIADAIDTTTSCETVQLPPASPPPPPVIPQGTPDPAPDPVIPAMTPVRLDATVVGRWGLGRRVTTVFELAVKRIPAGGKVEVRCHGKGCPFARRVIAPAGGTAPLTKLFANRKLRRGTVVEVRVTAPGMVGKVVRYTMRTRRKLPRTAPLCLPPGATKPVAC